MIIIKNEIFEIYKIVYHWYPNLWLVFYLLCEEILLVQVPIFICVRILDELNYIVITDHNVQILVENLLDFLDPNQPFLLPIEKGEKIHGFFFFPSSVKPLFVNKA